MKNNKHRKPGFRAALRSDGVYELLVYEEIGENWWTGEGITAKKFKLQLDAAGTYSRIALRINSPGGDAFEGIAILNMLKSIGKPIAVYVDGLAASAASIIAMCGDSITMGSGAMLMIHNAWNIAMGNANEFERQAAALNSIDQSIAQVYVDRTGQKLADVTAMMDAETWLGADEAIEKGFATGKAAGANEDALAMARGFKALAKFSKTPKEMKPAADADDTDTECACDCANCVAGDCANCTNEGCDTPFCEDCPMQADAEAKARANGTMRISAELFRDLAIPAGFAQMAARWQGRLDIQLQGNEILALRRVPGAVLNLAPRADGTGTQARVSGVVAPYGSASGDMGGFQEIYQTGCFDKFLKSDDPRVLAFHNPEHVLGRKSAGTARFWSDAAGLHYEADLPDTQVARDLRVSMERKDVRESSAAFYITDYAWEQRDGIRTRVIKEARLVEASPYSFPAYPESTAAAIEEAPQDAADANELELIGARLQLLKIA